MSVWLELVLLLAALAVTAVLGTDLVRRRLDRERERRHLERLESGAEEDPQTASEVGGVARRLRAAGAPIGPLPYLAGSVLLAAGAFFVALSGFGGRPIVALGVAVIAVWVPWGLLGSWALHRSRRFEEKLVDAVGYMTSALQAGDNPSGALATAGESAEAPTGPELRRVADRLAAGMSVRQALQPMAEGYDSEGLRIFSQTLIAKWDVGGDLAPVLLRVSRVMRDRLALKMRLRSELAGARLGALIVSVLPYLLLPVLLWRRPEWLRSLLEHPVGLQLLLAAILMQLLGVLWLRQILRSDLR